MLSSGPLASVTSFDRPSGRPDIFPATAERRPLFNLRGFALPQTLYMQPVCHCRPARAAGSSGYVRIQPSWRCSPARQGCPYKDTNVFASISFYTVLGLAAPRSRQEQQQSPVSVRSARPMPQVQILVQSSRCTRAIQGPFSPLQAHISTAVLLKKTVPQHLILSSNGGNQTKDQS